MSDPTWFHRPTADRPGTLNAVYQLLDHPIVGGRADEPVVDEHTHAQLLELVAAVAGALRSFGVRPGDRILLDAEGDPERAAVTLLAALRLGAIAVLLRAGDGDAAVVVLDPDGFHLTEDVVAWDVAVKAGRLDPAPAAELAPDAPGVLLPTGALTTVDLATRLAAASRRTPLTATGLVAELTGPTIEG